MIKVAPLTNKRIVKLIKQSYQIREEMSVIRAACKHKYKPTGKGKDKYDWGLVSACIHCGDDSHGWKWWCPKSPTHMCDYSKSWDDCLYCRLPEERK